jgi:hypothetical protein
MKAYYSTIVIDRGSSPDTIKFTIGDCSCEVNTNQIREALLISTEEGWEMREILTRECLYGRNS